ncbi:acyl carrier protein [Streptomyces blattellae]|uniref:acyl carrier protein n=1 Tax=Streptomyces blattellae TaxID=2569855 RepID=UPI0012B9E8FD|nr:acyl carrier protein [Streptomyces blattellae]
MTQTALDRVTELAAQHLGCPVSEVAPDREFVDLGADSFQMVSVLRELEEGFGARVMMRELFEEAATPQLLVKVVPERMQPGAGAAVPAPAPTDSESEPAPAAPTSAEVLETAPAATAEQGYASQNALDLLARQVQVIAEGQLHLPADGRRGPLNHRPAPAARRHPQARRPPRRTAVAPPCPAARRHPPAHHRPHRGDGGAVRIRPGAVPVELPAPVAELALQQVAVRRSHAVLAAARLRTLVIGITDAVTWQRAAAGDWAAYAAEVNRRTPPQRPIHEPGAPT